MDRSLDGTGPCLATLVRVPRNLELGTLELARLAGKEIEGLGGWIPAGRNDEHVALDARVLDVAHAVDRVLGDDHVRRRPGVTVQGEGLGSVCAELRE